MTTAGLLLAAGAGRRFGRPKALVELDGESLATRGARLLADGGCRPVLVVIGAQAHQVRAATRLPAGARFVAADDWATGMGASLRAGLAALAGDESVDAVVVALADQPRVGVEAVRRLAGSSRRDDALVATYGGRPRNPVLLRRAIWAEVATAARGDVGARAWLLAHPDQVGAVACDGTGWPDDVDEPADLARLAGPERRAGPADGGRSPRAGERSGGG